MSASSILVALFAAVSATAADSTPKFVAPRTIAELESRIQRVLDSAKVPGIGLAIVRHDSVIYTGGLGRARVAPTVKATDSTLFRIGSTSKAFVALTVQALVREGRLSLDQPLSQALPGFYFENPWESTDPVRIVHLLEHTSGFDDNSLKSYANSNPVPLPLPAGLALDSATRVSRWRPGTRFSYCNTGPAIVALIIERIEGKPFEQVVQDRWFTPIGMKTATYFRPDSTKVSAATLYRADGTSPVPYWHVFVRPAGSINASSHDMAAYVRFLLGRGTIDGKALLPSTSIERMERSASSMAARTGLAVGYGLHLYHTADTTGFSWTGHNGAVDGGLSDMSYLPGFGVGYAFQINAANGEAFGLITRLVRAFLTQGIVPPPPPAVVTAPASTSARFTGWYRGVSPRTQHLYVIERIPGIVHVTFRDSTMRLKPILGDAIDFVAVDSVRFRQPGQSEATLVFVRDDANGRAEGIEWVGATLGVSMARVTAVDGVGRFAVAVVWIAGLCLSGVAMAFGALRFMIRRVRRRSVHRASTAPAWRIAAAAASLVVVQIALFSVGIESVQTLGNPTPISVSIWVIGMLFGFLALLCAWVAVRVPASPSRWALVSRWSVRAVAGLNVVAATYLLVNGWIGWRTWL
ncbi:MAG: serine hydrolase [Gemmatimonadaceae bacterium]|nr:serine hydrolase [Gemmatimonadaceae bacterium]